MLALCVLVCAVWLVHGLGYLEDDGWIHLEFARSVAAGQGFQFNGRVVYGDTSPLWVWLLCGVHVLGLSWENASKALDLVGCLFAVGAVYEFGRSLTRALQPVLSQRFAAACALVLVTGPYFGYWSFSGMEALASCGVAAVACTLVARERLSSAAFLGTALCAGIAPILRPEMAFLSVLLGLTLLVRLLKMDTTPQRKGWLFVAGLLLLALPFGLWARYAVHTFGSVLPTTNAAKRAAPGESVVKKLVTIYSFGFPEALFGIVLLGIWAAVSIVRHRMARVRALLLDLGPGAWLIGVWIAIAVCFYIVDHTYVQTRYIMVNAPLLAIVVLAAAVWISPRVARVAIVLTVLLGIGISWRATWPLVRNKVALNASIQQLASYLRTLPADEPVADYSIGQIAFQSQHTIVDTGGITRPGMIPYMWDKTPERPLAWMRSQGAALSIGAQPAAGAKLVWSRPAPPVGWHLSRSYYDAPGTLELWTIPPGPSDPTKLPAP